MAASRTHSVDPEAHVSPPARDGALGVGQYARSPHDTLGGQVGSFYSNVTLLGAKLDDVQAVSPRPAFLFADADAVVVFAAADDEGAPRSGEALSAALGCIAVSIGVHDDDILFFEVHDTGESIVSGAVPDPADYFGFDADTLAELDPSMLEGLEPAGSSVAGGPPDATALVAAIGRGDVEKVREAFEQEFVFVTERHDALASALGLPRAAVGWGYLYLSRDDTGYAGPSLVKI